MAWTKLNLDAPQYDSTGWCEKTGMTCHATLGKYVKNLPFDCLHYVTNDCRLAIEAMPEGRKAGHYADTIHGINDRVRRMGE